MASRTNDQHDQLLKELNAERLAALTRISGTLETLIADLRDLRQRIMALPDAERYRELVIYRELRTRARQYRWYLEVQREALGLRHHRILDELFEIPGGLESDSLGT
jgi:hypothetical protein